MDMELTTETLYIVRAVQPVLLEVAGDFEHYHGIWGMFENYRFDTFQQLLKIEKDERYYLIVLDGGCEESEMENMLIWHTFREREIFGQGFLVSKRQEPERYADLTKKWNLQNACEALFIKRINNVTLDKFRASKDFIGKFTLDDYTRKITTKHAKRHIASQPFNDIASESDYRLVGNNIDSTCEELNADFIILFYNRQQLEFDELFNKIRKLVQGDCEDEQCGEHEGLVDQLRRFRFSMFSFNVSLNDLPSFVIDQVPCLLVFKRGEEDPREVKFESGEEMVAELKGLLARESRLMDEDL